MIESEKDRCYDNNNEDLFELFEFFKRIRRRVLIIKIYLKTIFIIEFNDDFEFKFSKNFDLMIEIIFNQNNNNSIIYYIRKEYYEELFYRLEKIITVFR